MSSVETRLTKQQTLAVCAHTSVSGDTWQYVKPGVTSNDGDANGTTLIDYLGDSGAAKAYAGRYWVKILSGACKGQWKRIIVDDGAGTLTLENNGFSAQIVTGVDYEIWKSPDPVVVVTSSSSANNIADTSRTEPDDFWYGYWAIVISGTNRGQKAQVSDFTSSGGVFALGSGLSSTLTAGDVVILRKFLETSLPADGTTEEYLPRRSVRTDFSEGDGVVGQRAGTFNFESDWVGSGYLAAAAGSPDGGPTLPLWTACGYDATQQRSCVVVAGGNGTDIKITTGQQERLTIGGPIVWHGNVAWVTALTDGGIAADTVTVTPPFTVAPAATDVLHAGIALKRTTTGDSYGCLIEHWVDGVRTTMTGCKGNVVINDGSKVTLAWSLNVDRWIEEIEDMAYSPSLCYSTAATPMLSQSRNVYKDGTKIDISGFTCSLNTETAPKTVSGANGVNGRAGFHITGQSAGGSYRQLMTTTGDAFTQRDDFDARTSFSFVCTWGSHANSAGVRMPVVRVRERAKREDASGLQAVAVVIQAQDAGATADGSGAMVKNPDFCVALF